MKSKLAIFGGKPVLSKPLLSYNSIGKEEVAAVNRLMKDVAAGKAALSGFLGRGGAGFLGGPLVRGLEDDFKKYFKTKHAISFNSATTALQAAVSAIGVGPGDEVITSPFTMCATSTAVLLNNAVPVFADIDPKTYCLSAETITPLINERTKAIIVVNLLGGSADYEPILKLAEKHNLKIIEDNAQAPGATYKGKYTGTIGDLSVFSFNVHKTMQSGEGGMIITNSDRYAYRSQLVRNHGEAVVADDWNKGDVHRELVAGSNYRFTELQAAIVLEQFKKLPKLTAVRVKLAGYLSKKLKSFSWLEPASVLPKSKHVYYLYPFKFFAGKIGISRKTFVAAMKAEGFSLSEGYNFPSHLMPIYQKKKIFEDSHFPFVSQEYPHSVDYSHGTCPVVERMWEKELLTTTICQSPKTTKDIDLFILALKKIEAGVEELKKLEN